MSERQKLDFAAIKDAVTIEQVMNLLSITARKSSGQYRCECPTHPGNSRGLAITPSKGFYCFSEKQGGDQIALYAHVRECNNYDAALALSQHFRVGGKPAPPRVEERKPARTSVQQSDLQPLDYLETDHPAIELLGLTEDVCNAIGIGFANKGTMNGRVVFPLRLEDGRLIGYIGLATKPDQAPLLKIPTNLADLLGAGGTEREAEQEPPKTKDELRRLLRVV